eukprot:4424103-Amphidinium_carterae.1
MWALSTPCLKETLNRKGDKSLSTVALAKDLLEWFCLFPSQTYMHLEQPPGATCHGHCSSIPSNDQTTVSSYQAI